MRSHSCHAVLSALIVGAVVLVWSAPASAATTWSTSASATKGVSSVVIASRFTAPAATSGTFVMDTEVHNSSGGKVAQWVQTKYTTSNQQHSFTYSWNASAMPSGKYVVKQGVFTRNWAQNRAWNNSSTVIQVGTSLPVSFATGSALVGANFYGPNEAALRQAQQWGNTSGDARLMQRLGNTPTTKWFGGWSGDVRQAVSNYVRTPSQNGQIPVLVAYNIVNRDCNGYSSGGASDEGSYKWWISQFAEGVGSVRAVVILEPDAVAQSCGDTAARNRMLNYAVDVLNARSGVSVYVDGGHPDWIDSQTMANRLAAAGTKRADGFAVNVSSFTKTSSSEAYGEDLSRRLGGKHYVVDTSRNGNGGTPGVWCNPRDARVGQVPTSRTNAPNNDAYLWINVVGNSDGYCNGGPAAGQWHAGYALQLVQWWR